MESICLITPGPQLWYTTPKPSSCKMCIRDRGGFDHDDEMRAKHMPFKILATNAALTNTGDGHKMGMAIGADVSFMDSCWGAPAILTTGQDPHELIESGTIAQELSLIHI